MFGGSIYDVTYEYVYLGVNFNYNTSFIKAIERHISRAKRAMFAIVTKSSMVSHRGHNCISSALTILDSALTS